MTTEIRQKKTSTNIQEKANLIWAIADKLVGLYKPHEYGKVILPMCVIKRFEDTLATTKQAVIDKNKYCEEHKIEVREPLLRSAADQQFYNTSEFTFELLLADADNIHDNFEFYLSRFSNNVIDIISRMDFHNEIKKMADNNRLYVVIKEFCSANAYLGADKISAVDMGYIFEELVRKFSESYNDQAGAHFTARDIIHLMTELLIGDREQELQEEGIVASIYDMAMGTSQMLACMEERFAEIDPEAETTCYGQELNPQTFGIAKADMLIKGGNADNMQQGDTLGDDKFKTYKFDYIISNPPFGIDWEASSKAVQDEHLLGEAGRFEPGLPAKGDGQMLFMLNGVAKLKDEGGRMAIIQNGSPLFKGDAGSGESAIRGYLLENDWLEAIIQLPNDLFYNTGIATYIWVISKSKSKSEERRGKVQLLDASKCFEKRRKPIGNKRVEISTECRDMIMRAYNDFCSERYESGDLVVESKIKDNEDFKFTKLTINRPLRLKYVDLAMPEDQGKLKDAEVALLKQIVELYSNKYTSKSLNDTEFFAALKSGGVKVTAAQIKKVRQILGAKDEAFSEVYNNPHKAVLGDFAMDSDLSDTEIVAWKEDIAKYLDKNVLPYAPDFVEDESKRKIGYEIPLTREFYKYVELRKSEDIFVRLKELETAESELMIKILG